MSWRRRIRWAWWRPIEPSRELVQGVEHAKKQLARAEARDVRVAAVVRAQEASRRDNFTDAFTDAFFLRSGRQGHRS